MILTKEILLFQKRAGIITEVEYKEKIKIIEGEEQVDPEAEENAEQGLDAGLSVLVGGIDSVEPSPKDKELKEFEPVSLTAGIIASAPGLISLAGKAVNFIASPFLKDGMGGTKVGNALKKFGHEMEEVYLKALAELLKKSFPQTLGIMPYNPNNELGKAAKTLYIGILAAAGLRAGMLNANIFIAKGIGSGLSEIRKEDVEKIVSLLIKK